MLAEIDKNLVRIVFVSILYVQSACIVCKKGENNRN